MVTNQSRSNRKPSGSRYKKQLVRRQHESGGRSALTRLDEHKKVQKRIIGGNQTEKLLAGNIANVVNTQTGKHDKAIIKSVKENPANRHFVRRNIMTKGAIIETDKGDAKITSRPGQDGVIQAVLL